MDCYMIMCDRQNVNARKQHVVIALKIMACRSDTNIKDIELNLTISKLGNDKEKIFFSLSFPNNIKRY